MRRALVLLPPALWLLLFLAAPAAILCAIAFATPEEGIPPFALGHTTDNLVAVLSDPLYRRAFILSVQIAAVSTLACVLIGYPMALAIARAPARRQGILLLLVIMPFWTGFLLRITAWIGLLRDGGWIDAAMMAAGLTTAPLHLLYTDFAVYVGIAYCYLPFMVLPLYARLSKRDVALEQAAADLGAAPLSVFFRITFPLSLPGLAAGVLLVFVPALGEYVIPELLGGPAAETAGRVLWSEFFQNHDWPTAASLGVVLLGLLLVPAGLWGAARR